LCEHSLHSKDPNKSSGRTCQGNDHHAIPISYSCEGCAWTLFEGGPTWIARGQSLNFETLRVRFDSHPGQINWHQGTITHLRSACDCGADRHQLANFLRPEFAKFRYRGHVVEAHIERLRLAVLVHNIVRSV
jgi:hypothetical protein